MAVHQRHTIPLHDELRILFIDEDKEDSLFIKETLNQVVGQSFKFYWKASYEAGLQELTARREPADQYYDAVLVAERLGSFSGVDFIREANERGCPSPLILLTGPENGEVAAAALQAGAALCLPKSDANPLLMASVIRYAVERNRVESELRASNERLERELAESKRADEALLESQERLERAQQIAHLGSWELDLIQNRLSWSDEVYRIFGLQPQEFGATYEAFLEQVHPDDRKAVDDAYTGSLRENRDSYEIEHRVVRRATGEIRYVHEKCEHFRDASGRHIRSVGMVHDITERKQSEEKLRAYNEALRQSEIYFRQLADAMPQLVWTARPDGVVDYINRRFEEYTGYAHTGDHWEWAPAFHPDDLEMAVNNWAQTIETGEAQQLEVRLRKRDGSYRWHLIRAIPAKDDDGNVTRWYGTNTDIEDQKQTEERLRNSNQQLEQFAFVASHDLREPVRKIVMFGATIQHNLKDKLDDDTEDYLERMVNAGERMQAMIEALLDLSRVNRQTRPFVRVDLTQIAAEAVSDLESSIYRGGGQVQIEALPSIEADPLQLHQVFINLIGNGLKFHKADVPPVVRLSSTVFVSPGTGERMVSIHFEDNGIGIDDESKEIIFLPFHRLHRRSEYEGTGMGLAIVKKIVERHHGEISVSSTPNEGATFTVTLPVTHVASSGEFLT